MSKFSPNEKCVGTYGRVKNIFFFFKMKEEKKQREKRQSKYYNFFLAIFLFLVKNLAVTSGRCGKNIKMLLNK